MSKNEKEREGGRGEREREGEREGGEESERRETYMMVPNFFTKKEGQQ